MRVFTQFTEHRIGYISYTRLDGEEGSRNTSGFELRLQESGYVRADLRRGFIDRRESRNLIRTIGLHDRSNLRGIDLDMVGTAAIGGFVDRYLATLRRVEGFVQVMHAPHRSREHLVPLDDDLISQTTDSRHNTDTGSRHDRTVFAYIRGLDDGPFGFRKEAVTQVLRHMREVTVEIVGTFGIDLLAHRLIRLVRRAEVHRVSTRQSAITTVTHRSAGLQTYTERNTLLVESLCALRQSKRNRLRHSRGRKTTHA